MTMISGQAIFRMAIRDFGRTIGVRSWNRLHLKEPVRFFNFFQTFWDREFDQKNAYLFLTAQKSFTADRCSIWYILVKRRLIMVTIISSLKVLANAANKIACTSKQFGWLTEIWKWNLWGGLLRAKHIFFLKNETIHL